MDVCCCRDELDSLQSDVRGIRRPVRIPKIGRLTLFSSCGPCAYSTHTCGNHKESHHTDTERERERGGGSEPAVCALTQINRSPTCHTLAAANPAATRTTHRRRGCGKSQRTCRREELSFLHGGASELIHALCAAVSSSPLGALVQRHLSAWMRPPSPCSSYSSWLRRLLISSTHLDTSQKLMC